MRESVIYQEILQEGRQEGRQEEGVTLVLRLLNRLFGTIDQPLRSHVTALPLALLEDLGEAWLDFTEPVDLLNWLQRHQP